MANSYMDQISAIDRIKKKHFVTGNEPHQES